MDTFHDFFAVDRSQLIAELVEEGRKIGKTPFCVDGNAEMCAFNILNPYGIVRYPQEMKSERDARLAKTNCRVD